MTARPRTVRRVSPRAASRAGSRARRRRLAAGGLLTLGAVSATSGCAELWLGPAEVTVDEVAIWGPSEGSGNDALLEGVLTVEDGCVYVTDPSGIRWLPVFDADLVGWDGETLRTAWGSFADGDDVAIGGGVLVENGTGRWNPPDGLHVPAACDVTQVWSATR